MKQAELFVALRTFSPHDQKPVLDYLRTSVDAARAKEIAGTLAHLDNGEAWFIAPRWLNEVRRARFRVRRTFDSSRTPALGENLVAPKILAKVDLDRIRDAMSERLERELPRTRGNRDSKPAVAMDHHAAKIEEFEEKLTVADVRIASLESVNAALRSRLVRIGELVGGITEPSGSGTSIVPAEVKTPKALRSSGKKSATPLDGKLHPASQKMLLTIAKHHPAKFTWGQIATLTGLKASGGYYNSGRSGLRDLGYVVEGNDLVSATPAGLAASGVQPTSPSTPREWLQVWCESLPGVAPDMLRHLAKNGSTFMKTEALAEAIGRKPTGGYWNSGLAVLRNNGLVEIDGKAIRAAEIVRI
jgi:hypothetical protein